jgi:hypothetical protein
MDTTMRSANGWSVPILPPIGLVTSGPHHYDSKTWVGSISQGNTPQQAFESLSRHATPFQEGKPSVDGGIIDIPVLGPVRQHVDPDHLTIVNETEPGHLLHPGKASRSILQEGDDLYAATRGEGNGIFPTINEEASPYVWESVDRGIRSELDPHSWTAYPADAMSAVGSPSGVDPTNLPQPQQGGLGTSVNPPVGQRVPLFFGSP